MLKHLSPYFSSLYATEPSNFQKSDERAISSLRPGLRTNRVGREQNGNFAHDEWDANLKFQFYFRKYISITLLDTHYR